MHLVNYNYSGLYLYAIMIAVTPDKNRILTNIFRKQESFFTMILVMFLIYYVSIDQSTPDICL
jgi:hypothetical protein